MPMRWGVLSWPGRWWGRQSLRARLTLIATALFSVAVISGAVLAIYLQRYALVRTLDAAAARNGREIAAQVRANPELKVVVPTSGGVTQIQVVDADDTVLAASPGADHVVPLLNRSQLAEARDGTRFDIDNPSGGRLRVLVRRSGSKTVIVATDLDRVDDSVRALTEVAAIGGPIAVVLMGLATYLVVALTLRPVAALRHGAADITAAGLADQRLPVPRAQDEIYRLAVTLNAMLDRIDSATARQRTFIGDAAHELRSPLASLRLQLEVTQRIGPAADWPAFVDDITTDVSRLDRLVSDLLLLARLDETRGEVRREPVALDALVADVVGGYSHARVPVRWADHRPAVVDGDPDGLRRVVVNLVDNAVRYAATEVQVSLTPAQLRRGRAVALTVVDDGPGIPESERDRVFDRFYRTEESRSRESGGTGLGLPIVRDLVRAHGGAIRLSARPDRAPGLQATVTLPLPGPSD
jgi:signal transduction histidine kinase